MNGHAPGRGGRHPDRPAACCDAVRGRSSMVPGQGAGRSRSPRTPAVSVPRCVRVPATTGTDPTGRARQRSSVVARRVGSASSTRWSLLSRVVDRPHQSRRRTRSTPSTHPLKPAAAYVQVVPCPRTLLPGALRQILEPKSARGSVLGQHRQGVGHALSPFYQTPAEGVDGVNR